MSKYAFCTDQQYLDSKKDISTSKTSSMKSIQKRSKSFKRFNVTEWLNQKKTQKIQKSQILASGSMVIRGKPDNMLGPQSVRKIGSEVAIMQHNGEKLAKKLKQKTNNIEQIKKEISEKESEIKKLMVPPPKPKDYLRNEGGDDLQDSNEKKIKEIKSLEHKIESLIPK